MRTDRPSPDGAAMNRLRSGLARARRRIIERAPAWALSRGGGWTLALAIGAAALVALSYAWNGQAGRAKSGAYVLSGEPFSPDDLIRVRKALQAKNVPFRIDGRNRVEVAPDRLTEANEAVARLEVGPRPLDDREKRAQEANPFESPWARERREEQARLDQLAEIVRRLDPGTIASARVQISRPRATLASRRQPSATAFVYLETFDDREVNWLIVKSVMGMVASFDPEVRQDAVSVWDRKGRHYADARDPALAALARARARAAELGDAIRHEIGWIKGVQVSVNLLPSPVVAPSPVQGLPGSASASPAVPELPPLPEDLPPAIPAEDLEPAAPIVGVNQPLDLAAEPPPPGTVRDGEPWRGRPHVATEDRGPSRAPRPSPTPVEEAERPSRVAVWVKVPRSYYLRALSSREPSREELQSLVLRTEDQVRTAVEHLVPDGERAEIKINTIPDEWPTATPPPPSTTGATRPWPEWAYAVAGASASAALLATGSWLFGGRRAAPRRATRPEPARFKIDEATGHAGGPGPSERVRELIRRNPEAAASVLLRWTGQGGSDS